MKKYVLIFGLALLTIVPASAQQTDTVFQKREVIIIDEEPVPNTQTREVIIRDVRAQHAKRKNDGLRFFRSIGLGYNGLVENLGNLNLPEGAEWMELKPKSINFNLMMVGYDYRLSKHLSFQTGLELEVNNYRFENDVTLKLDENGHIAPDWRFRDAGHSLRKSKLVNCFFNVPLTLNVGIGNKNQVRVYGGVVGGWRWNSYTKLRANNDMLNGKKRNRDNYNLRNFHYGYTAGVMFHKFGVYATYYPHSIFKAGDIEARQVNIGIRLGI